MAKYYNESRKRAILKYQESNIKQVPLRLNRNTDGDIIRWLEVIDNVSKYIKDLIRDDMRKGRKS